MRPVPTDELGDAGRVLDEVVGQGQAGLVDVAEVPVERGRRDPGGARDLGDRGPRLRSTADPQSPTDQAGLADCLQHTRLDQLPSAVGLRDLLDRRASEEVPTLAR